MSVCLSVCLRICVCLNFLSLCRLPIETPGGEPLYADATVTGKKREAVLACATEACRMLDAAGLLRQSSHGGYPVGGRGGGGEEEERQFWCVQQRRAEC